LLIVPSILIKLSCLAITNKYLKLIMAQKYRQTIGTISQTAHFERFCAKKTPIAETKHLLPKIAVFAEISSQ
jgi:hypothetical protein